jgi:Mitochondrial protein Pet127
LAEELRGRMKPSKTTLQRAGRPTKLPISRPIRPRRPGPISAKAGTTEHEIKTIKADSLELKPIDKEPPEVPNLAYGLERVLFNPGVYHLQDPRSRVFNFDPYLQTIMPVSEFDFNALKQYITSSRDKTLLSKAKEEEKKYTGSTSSMTSALAHFHFLLSQWRPISTGILSQMFPVDFRTFTAIQRGPVAVFLRWRDGTYAIDADKEYDQSNILMMLGKSMEKFLTLPTNDFEKYRKANSDQISEEERNESEPFHYTTMGDFLLRSQLDAHDPRLPGTGMFDLKTRAVVSVRMDIDAFEEGKGYQIRGRHGEWESFEREYYDMIRAAFLKYSLQVRMGRMDGIFVAFHNTERIFGFQYISLPEMDYALHGTENSAIGDSEFKLSLGLLNRVLDRATAKFPKQSLRLHFETRDTETPFMYIFAEPVDEMEVEKIQATNKQKIEEFEREVLGVPIAEMTQEQKEAEWARLREKVEEGLQQDELGIDVAASEAEAKKEAELDESSAGEQLQDDELLASAALEDGEEDEEDEELEEILIDDSEEDDENILEDEEEHDEESEEITLEEGGEDLDDSELDEQAILDETLADDGEESTENLEEQNLDEQDGAEENLSDDLEDAEESESPQEEFFDEQTSSEELVAQYLEEADHLEESANQEETLLDEVHNEDGLDSTEHKDDNVDSVESDDHETSSDSTTFKDAAAILDALTSHTTSGGTEQASSNVEVAEFFAGLKAEEARKLKLRETEKQNSEEDYAELADRKPLLAMTLAIRNKVNDQYVERPEELEEHEKWEVEYALSEVESPERARKLYTLTKERRWRALKTKSKDPNNVWNNTYISNIKKMSEKGREWRKNQDRIEKHLPVKTLDIKQGKNMEKKDRDVWHRGSKGE